MLSTVFTQVVTMVAGEDDNGVVSLACFLKRGENLTNQHIDLTDA